MLPLLQLYLLVCLSDGPQNEKYELNSPKSQSNLPFINFSFPLSGNKE